MPDVAYLSLPVPVLDIIGWEDNASISGGIALVLPSFTFGIGDASQQGTHLALPVPALSITGTPGITGTVQLSLPLPTLAISVPLGVIGGAALQLPALQLRIGSPNQAVLQAPTPTLAAAGATGAIGSISLQLPALSLIVAGTANFSGSVALSLLPQLAVAGVTGNIGSVVASLRQLALAAQGYTGNIGSAALTLPVIQLSAAGQQAVVGSATLQLPLLILQATGVVPVTTYSTIVMHTETQGLTTYENYPFNSFAKFNGVYLAAGDGGIFALTGADDDGVAIAAAARTGITGFGSSHLKRVSRAYIGYRASGDMLLRVITSESDVHDYPLQATVTSGLHGNHVQIGKGIKARYWQFEIRNVNGADFELDEMEIKPIILARRRGGRDA